MVLAHDIVDGKRTQDIRIPHDVTFDTMLLTENTLQGLHESGFYKPSPIQLHGIPLGKCGFDLILEAKSGTGKTAVFSVIALEKIDLTKGLQIAILAPTREIAAQICDVIKQIGSCYKDLQVAVVMGGLSLEDDIAKFKNNNIHIVVGSPGRLRHLIQCQHINVTTIRLLVLDEADKLVEKSFQADINYIFSVLPKQKQVIMSSATYPENTKPFLNKYVQNAQHVCPDSDSILLGIKQKITLVKYNSNIVRQTNLRFEELHKILSKQPFKQCLIFCNYQARVSELYKMLTKAKWPAEQLYGQQDQSDRLDALKTLQEYKCRILVSTDLAARGIDASNVDLVINFEPPFEWQTYLHRIGRAGRFGSYGIAITILSVGKEEKRFMDMVASIKASLKLIYLWDDENHLKDFVDCKFEQSDITQTETLLLNSKVQENESADVILNNLWDRYAYEAFEIESQPETFDSLCKSFERTNESGILSFSSLINSFQSFRSGDICSEIKYGHLDIPIFPMTQYFTRIKDIHKQIESEQPISQSKLYEQLNNLNEVMHTKQTSNDSLRSGPSESINMNKHSSNDTKFFYEASKQTCEQNNIEDSADIIYQRSLLEAGLPTCFRSKKSAKIKRKHKVFNKLSTVNSEHFTNDKHHDNNKNCNKTKKSNFLKYAVHCEGSDNSNSENVNKGESSKNNPRIMNNRRVNDDRHNTMPCKYSKPGLDVGYYGLHEKYLTRKLSEDYINWYNQLKFRVKQIEFAVYIEEMLILKHT